MSRRQVAVYDRFWATGGGGERYAAGIAEVLAEDHDVTLLGHEPVDLDWLGARLGVDLSAVDVRTVRVTAPFDEVTAGYDLLVNASYRSHGPSGARRAAYVVHFPDRPGGDLRPWQRLARGRLAGDAPRARFGAGFHEADVIRAQAVRWTDGEGRLHVRRSAAGGTVVVHLGRFLPDGRPRTVVAEVGGAEVASTLVAPPRSRLSRLHPARLEVPLPPGAEGEVAVTLRSEATVADDVLGNGDHRRLGVPVVGVAIDAGWRAPLAAWASLALEDQPALAWLDSYDRVVSNSVFTQRWVRRWWGRHSEVLHPPVTLRRPGPAKGPVVLGVGRFIAPGRGHNKAQLELVEAFGQLARTGLADGWTLHLVGGCSPDDRPYLAQVERAAVGLPVELHVDVERAVLDRLYEEASIFWHATGLGVDLDADPVRAEHFGITTVEAMSAGAVPVVVDAGGQPEVVVDGVSGFTFRTLDELVATSARLVASPDLRAEVAAEAVARSRAFGPDAFRAGVQRTLGPLLERP